MLARTWDAHRVAIPPLPRVEDGGTSGSGLSRASTSPFASTRERDVWILAVVLVLVCGAFGIARGLAPSRVALAVGFSFAWIVAPGIVWRRRLRTRVEPSVVELGLALLLGLAALVGAFLVARGVDRIGWLAAWPLVSLFVAFAARRRAPAERVEASEARDRDATVEDARRWSVSRTAWALALALVATLSIVRIGDGSTAWYGVDVDQLFHVGNTAEMMRPAPALDPRVAGRSLNYHDFAYAWPATFARLFGVPAFDAASIVFASGLPALLAVLVLGAGLRVGRTWSAGFVALAFVLAHGDVARFLQQCGWPHSARLVAHQWPATNLLASPSGTLAVACGIGLALAIAEALAAPGRRRALVAVAAFAFLASGARGSLVPVVGLVGVLALAFAAWRRRRIPGLALVFVVIVLAATPKTLTLMLGADSYAPAMTAFDPLGSVAATPFAAGIIGRDPGTVARVALVAPWLLVWLGVPVVLALAWVATRARHLAWPVALVAVASLAPVLVVVLSMRSQLFFAHAGEVGACVLAGAALAGRERWRGRAYAAAWGLALVALVSGGVPAAARAIATSRAVPHVPAHGARWFEGVAWMRGALEEEALVAARHPCALVSAVIGRRALCDDPRFTPEAHAAGGPARVDLLARSLQDALYAAPSADVVQRVHDLAPRSPALYVVLDSVSFGAPGDLGPTLAFGTRAVAPALESDPRFTCVYQNEAIAVWRVPLDDGEPSGAVEDSSRAPQRDTRRANSAEAGQ